MNMNFAVEGRGDGSNLPSPIKYLPHEAKAVAKQKKRLSKLYAKRPDWVKTPANDNQAWPLAQQLRREGNDVLLRVAERYRAIYDASLVDVPLIGTMPDDLYNVPKDQRVHNREDGSVGYKGERKVKSAIGMFDGDDGAYKTTPISEEVTLEMEASGSTFPRKPAKPVPRKWRGDELINASIDSKVSIVHLQTALGPLLSVFEDAVLHGETLSAIGEKHGAKGVASRGPAGKAMVMLGLQTIREEFAQIDATHG